MLTVRELWEVIDREVAVRAPERRPLEKALGCVLRESICADADLPAFSRSAVDGFAVALNAPPGRFRIAGEVRPGQTASAVPKPGEAWKIFTGSALPEEGVGLVMVEDAAIEGENVVLRVPPDAGHIRARASQARQGQALLEAGMVLGPGAVALLASVGAADPLVSPRVRAAHLSTGAELVPVSQKPAPGFIRDSNTPLVAALLSAAGAERTFHSYATEDIAEGVKTLADAADADLFLISGGASVGEHDGARAILEKSGFTIRSAKVRSRPGKPMIFATRGPQVAFGLPGNPLAHFVCFQLFVRRAIGRLTGAEPAGLTEVILEGEPPAADPRETWWPARIHGVAGALRACPLPWRDSSDLTGLPQANALLRIPEQGANRLAEALIFGSLAP